MQAVDYTINIPNQTRNLTCDILISMSFELLTLFELIHVVSKELLFFFLDFQTNHITRVFLPSPAFRALHLFQLVCQPQN